MQQVLLQGVHEQRPAQPSLTDEGRGEGVTPDQNSMKEKICGSGCTEEELCQLMVVCCLPL